jgi:N-methylhydantoinase A
VRATKVPSTPDDPSRGFVAGVEAILALTGATAGDVEHVSHGTTVATNALLEDDVGALGLLVTKGFRHVLEIARQSVPDGYGNSYFWVKPDRIVPLHLVREIPERLAADGSVVRPLDEAAVVEAATWCREQGLDAVGVCLVNAYADPVHEQRVRDILLAEHPELAVSISSDVLREYREYERTVTTLVDAAVKPRVSRYLADIGSRLDGLGVGSFYVMTSNGGVAAADEVARRPLATVLSGPAAGALGAAVVARESGYEDVLTLDGGGTSTDVSLITGGEPAVTTDGSIGRHPIKVPMLDVVTVGTGGGSIAWVTPEGGLKVGPRSAGADPGPLCYGTGGTEPTHTDAHLVLGRLPAHLLGGRIPLDAEAAQTGLTALGRRVGLDGEATAEGVVRLAAWDQANAIRRVTVRRGLDVRDFALCAFGGSGPLLVCALIDVLGLPAALVPASPGTLSALGLLVVDARVDKVQTLVRRDRDLDRDELAATFARLEADTSEALLRQGFGADECRLVRGVDLRYFGQAFEVPARAPAGPIDDAFLATVRAGLDDEHQRQYGYSYRDDPDHATEWVNLRVTGIGPIERPRLVRADPGDGDPERARTGERPVVWGGEVQSTPVYAREKLLPDDVVAGPAVIEEFGSTVPLEPGFRATLDPLGGLVVTRA